MISLREARLDESVLLAELQERASVAAAECRLWVLESNQRARRFYERRGRHENGDTRVVPCSPNPIDVGYTIELETTLATL